MQGDLSLIPSPITTSPQMFIKSNITRIASQAAASAFSFSPRPIHSSVFKAALSVALRKSNSIIRSKSSYGGCCLRIVGLCEAIGVLALMAHKGHRDCECKEDFNFVHAFPSDELPRIARQRLPTATLRDRR